MKTNVHINSVTAYDSLPISKRQQDIISALRILGKATDRAIAEHLGYTTNRVTGRITELRDMGIVIEDGSIVGEFGKPNRICKLKQSEMLF